MKKNIDRKTILIEKNIKWCVYASGMVCVGRKKYWSKKIIDRKKMLIERKNLKVVCVCQCDGVCTGGERNHQEHQKVNN